MKNRVWTGPRRTLAAVGRVVALLVATGATSASTVRVAASTAPVIQREDGARRLVFATERSFQDFVSRRAPVGDPRFVSKRDALRASRGADERSRVLTGNPENQIDEDFPLVPYLDADGLIEIGGRTFKIDFTREIVGVLDRAHRRDLARLKAGDLGHARIRWFLFTDNVFEFLEAGSPGTVRSAADISRPREAHPSAIAMSTSAVDPDYCVGPEPRKRDSDWDKASEWDVSEYWNYDSSTASPCRAWIAEVKHVYQRTGIYYSLQSKIKYTRSQNNCLHDGPPYPLLPQSTDLTLTATWDYCRKVRFHSCSRSTGSRFLQAEDSELNHRSYEGSRSLEWFALDTTFTYVRTDPCSELVADKKRTIVLPRISKDY